MRADYEVVALAGQDGRTSAEVRYRGFTDAARVPMPPGHLYRPGSGRTLCKIGVDQTWERFPALKGVLSDACCSACRAARAAETAPR